MDDAESSQQSNLTPDVKALIEAISDSFKGEVHTMLSNAVPDAEAVATELAKKMSARWYEKPENLAIGLMSLLLIVVTGISTINHSDTKEVREDVKSLLQDVIGIKEAIKPLDDIEMLLRKIDGRTQFLEHRRPSANAIDEALDESE